MQVRRSPSRHPILPPAERPSLTIVPNSKTPTPDKPESPYERYDTTEVDPATGISRPTIDFRLSDPAARAALAEKMARKRAALAENARLAAEIQEARAKKEAKILAMAQLAGQRAILSLGDKEEMDVLIAGMKEYSGGIRPDYTYIVSARPGMHPDTSSNELVFRNPDDEKTAYTIPVDRIVSCRARTPDDPPLVWQGIGA